MLRTNTDIEIRLRAMNHTVDVATRASYIVINGSVIHRDNLFRLLQDTTCITNTNENNYLIIGQVVALNWEWDQTLRPDCLDITMTFHVNVYATNATNKIETDIDVLHNWLTDGF